MTTMITEVYDALRDAGASEEKARRAAEALAGHDQRFGRIEQLVAELRAELQVLAARIAAIETRLNTTQWVLGFVAAMEIAIFVKLFVH